MIKRNEVEGTVTISIADFDRLTAISEEIYSELDSELDKEREKVDKFEEGD